MSKKRLATLVLGSMIAPLCAEDFIDASKEIHGFTTQYEFGKPIKKNEAPLSQLTSAGEQNDTNMTTLTVDTTPETSAETIKNDLNITCGAKCGITLQKEDNGS